jgi:hypothetical protein
MVPALRVVDKNVPLVVARRSFGMTKLRSSRLDWHIFSHNRDNQTSVNRPQDLLTPFKGASSG